MSDIYKEFYAHVQALRTWETGPASLEYCVLGLIGEFSEFHQAFRVSNERTLDEAGDVLWYIQACCQASKDLGTLEFLPRSECERGVVLYLVGSLAEAAKKKARDNKPLTVDFYWDLAEVFDTVKGLLLCCDYTIEDALRHNINKLQKRYPNGFVPGGGIRE